MSATLEAANLQMLRCTHCRRIDTGPRTVCAGCLSRELVTEAIPGKGRLVSWTKIRRAPTRFRDEAPYDVVVVDLAAGPRVVGRLAGDSREPSIGDEVVAVSAEGANAIFTVEAA